MKLGSSRGMDTKRPRGSERSKPRHELQLTRPSQPPYPWPPEQAQPGVSKPCRTTLDQALAQYGPETKPARDKLKAGIVKGYETFWGGGDADPNLLSAAVPLANAQAMTDFLATLEPKTDAQKQALATASLYNSMVEQSRLLMSLQVASPPVSWVLIAILVFWTLALFFGIGLFAESNSLVLSVLAFGALSIAFAIFLILELGLPYTGLMRVSPAALEQAIELVDK